MVSRISGNTDIFKPYTDPPYTFASSVKRDQVITSSNFLVSISFLINIGKELSLPGFRSNRENYFSFLETIAAYDLKAGRCIQLNE